MDGNNFGSNFLEQFVLTPSAIGTMLDGGWGTSGGGGGGVSSVTWDPAQHSANVNLSGGNLTATTSGVGGFNFNGRSLIGGVIVSPAKRFWENLVTGAGGSPGLVNSSFAFTDTNTYLGIDGNGIAYYSTQLFFNNAPLVTGLAAYGLGDLIGMACNGLRLWIQVNGGSWNNDIIANQNPALGVGGLDISGLGATIYPAFNVQGAAGALVGNFGSTFVHTPPAGFSGFP